MLLAVLAVAWHATLLRTTRALDVEAELPGRPPAAPSARAYVMATCAHAAVGTWFRVIALLFLVYVAACLLMQLFRFLPGPLRMGVMLHVIDPATLMHAVTPEHLAAHAVILSACLFAPFLPLMMWLREEDLATRARVRGAALRLAFALPALSLACTAAYALHCVGQVALAQRA